MRVTCVCETAMAMEVHQFLELVCLFYCASLECRREQRATIKASVAWGFDVPQTYRALEAVWGTHTLSKTQVRHWFKVFSDDPGRGTAD